jgi:hypothetical protein
VLHQLRNAKGEEVRKQSNASTSARYDYGSGIRIHCAPAQPNVRSVDTSPANRSHQDFQTQADGHIKFGPTFTPRPFNKGGQEQALKQESPRKIKPMQKYHLHLSHIVRERNKDNLTLGSGVMG